MEFNKDRKKNIPEIVEEINKSYDAIKITELENQIACMFAAPIMFVGTVANLILGYLILHGNIVRTLIDSTIFLCLGLFFEFFLRTKLKREVVSFSITLLFCLWFLFLLYRLYPVIGPSVWMIACIQMVFALSRLKKNMAIAIGIVTFLSSIYCVLYPASFQYEITMLSLITQSVLLAFLILMLSVIHRINRERYWNLVSQYHTVTDQKNDISALYEEISATEEELRLQNSQLLVYMQDLRKGEDKLHKLAYYDVLTNLPNRTMFMEQLEFQIEKAKLERKIFYIALIDVDFFKKINDTMGHNAGDTFLLFATDNLKKRLKEDDFLSRIGGDEFAMIINRDLNNSELLTELDAIRTGFYRPFIANGIEVRLSASFGIAVFPIDGDNASTLLKSADMSMYKAKENGRNNIQFFNKYMLDEMMRKTEIENRLRSAIDSNEFYLVFQPQYCLKSNKIRGLEALARWNSPELGAISPLQFIAIAEESGQITLLGNMLLKMACQIFKALIDQYNLEMVLCVNISTVQLEDSKFIDIVKSTLTETGLEAKYLELEITESVFIESFHHTLITLQDLKDIGVSIALDDFGTGYSSLNYLKSLPIDILKVDKSFIDDLDGEQNEVQIVRDIIALGHTLGLAVIAEGVEHQNQLQYLKEYLCDHIQGYLMAKPMTEEDLRDFLNINISHISTS